MEATLKPFPLTLLKHMPLLPTSEVMKICIDQNDTNNKVSVLFFPIQDQTPGS